MGCQRHSTPPAASALPSILDQELDSWWQRPSAVPPIRAPCSGEILQQLTWDPTLVPHRLAQVRTKGIWSCQQAPSLQPRAKMAQILAAVCQEMEKGVSLEIASWNFPGVTSSSVHLFTLSSLNSVSCKERVALPSLTLLRFPKMEPA